MTYRWTARSIDDATAVSRLQEALNGLPAALARALVLRGIDSFDAARRFFRAGRDDLHDPFLMQDMDRAADRVVQAIEQNERVLVYGDYDVDGTTATTLLTDFLRTHGVKTATGSASAASTRRPMPERASSSRWTVASRRTTRPPMPARKGST
jgi:single-stranded-DNA-specific exonuclease